MVMEEFRRKMANWETPYEKERYMIQKFIEFQNGKSDRKHKQL